MFASRWVRPIGQQAAVVCVVLLALAVGREAQAQGANDPVTIGVIIPQSGAVAAYGRAQEEAFKIFEQVQAEQPTSAFGRKLKFKIVNDNSDASQATAAAREMAADPSVVGIICCSSTALML